MLPSATPSPSPVPLPVAARLEGFQHIFQTWNNCGPATLAMTLSYFGLGLSQNQTASVLKPNPEDRNVSPNEMVAYVDDETPYEALSRVNGDLAIVRRLVSQGIPVILEIGIDPPGEFRWLGWYGHYLLVVAYDDTASQFWVYDSWFGTSEEPLKNAHRNGRILSYAEARTYWPHFNRTYIAIYRPEEADLVTEIVGPDMDDATMWQKALTIARADAATDPENAFFWFNLGTVYNALGQYEQAAIAFDQARAIGLPWRMLWYQFGPYEAYYQIGRYDDVILLADVTLKDRPYFEEAFYYRGLAQQALGNLSEAADDFQRSVEFNPNFSLAVAALAEIDG
jgi:tetratricopeptide (TPR) repeat protein